MGPITLFDKSFLQSLKIDESMWFDNFFYSVICPIFYVETLADLKKTRLRRPPEQEVGIIADKFPEMHCAPIPHHQAMVINDLLGNHVPLTGQIPRDLGRLVKSDEHKGIVFQQSPEEKAFLRWQSREFYDLEREFASTWRANLESYDLRRITDEFRKFGISGRSYESLQEAKSIADAFVNKSNKTLEMLEFVFVDLNVSQRNRDLIMRRWLASQLSPLSSFAPYAAYFLSVRVFFQISLEASQISSDRRSNLLDIAYLYYLPFCEVFVSSDKLHFRCAPLFLRENQSFIRGAELKHALSELDEYYSVWPESEKKKGVMHFASHPPTEVDSIVSKKWDKYRHGWRELTNQQPIESSSNPEIVKKLTQLTDASSLQMNAFNFDPADVSFMSIRRQVHKKKGKWWQLPHDLESESNKED